MMNLELLNSLPKNKLLNTQYSTIFDLIEIAKKIFLGYIIDPTIIKNLTDHMALLNAQDFQNLSKNEKDAICHNVIDTTLIFFNISILHSNRSTEKLTYYDEFLLLLSYNREITRNFKAQIQTVFKYFDIGLQDDVENWPIMDLKKGIFFCQRAYPNIIKYPNLLERVLEIILKLDYFAQNIEYFLFNITEYIDINPHMANYVKKILYLYKVTDVSKNPSSDFSKENIKYFYEIQKFNRNPFFFYLGPNYTLVLNTIRNAPTQDLYPDFLPENLKIKLTQIIESYQEEYFISRPQLPITQSLIYILTKRSAQTLTHDSKKIVLINFVYLPDTIQQDKYIACNKTNDNTMMFEKQIIESAQSIKLVSDIFHISSHHDLYLAIEGNPILYTHDQIYFKSYDYDSIRKIISQFPKLLGVCNVKNIFFTTKALRPDQHNDFFINVDLHYCAKNRIFELESKNIQYIEHYLPSSQSEKMDQVLFSQNKWPLDFWPVKCFDDKDFTQIFLSYSPHFHSSNNIACKVFSGNINKTKAYLYIQDPKIKNGMFGEQEAQYFIAACMLSFLEKTPLYVLHDGNGLNFEEGLKSINQTCIALMFTTLLTKPCTKKQFVQYILEHGDHQLQSLLNFLRHQYITNDVTDEYSKCVIVSATIGECNNTQTLFSAASTISIMLGTPCLSEHMDLTANSKEELIQLIRTLHTFFCDPHSLNEIAFINKNNTPQLTKSCFQFNESILSHFVDNGLIIPLKKDNLRAHSLFSCLTKLAGKSVICMGHRTSLRPATVESDIKAKDTIEMATKMQIPLILVYAHSWYHGSYYQLEDKMLHSKHFYHTYNSFNGLQIHIITRVEGLYQIGFNFKADLIIFVNELNHNIKDHDIIRSVAHTVVGTLKEAFILSEKILSIKETSALNFGQNDVPKSSKQFYLPNDLSNYDVVSDVILELVDEHSFIELNSNLAKAQIQNNLVTGLCKINNKSFGIIADNPCIQNDMNSQSVGVKKSEYFIQLVDKLKLPLLVLTNSTENFCPAISRAYIDYLIPTVSIAIHKTYGAKLIQSFSKFSRPAIVSLSLKGTHFCPIDPQIAFEIVHDSTYQNLLKEGHSQKAYDLKDQFIRKYEQQSQAQTDGIDSKLIDWVIYDPQNLQQHIFKALRLVKINSSI